MPLVLYQGPSKGVGFIAAGSTAQATGWSCEQPSVGQRNWRVQSQVQYQPAAFGTAFAHLSRALDSVVVMVPLRSNFVAKARALMNDMNAQNPHLVSVAVEDVLVVSDSSEVLHDTHRMLHLCNMRCLDTSFVSYRAHSAPCTGWTLGRRASALPCT